MHLNAFGGLEGYPRFDYLVGINCGGGACGDPLKPDLYIDMRCHAQWIYENIPELQVPELQDKPLPAVCLIRL